MGNVGLLKTNRGVIYMTFNVEKEMYKLGDTIKYKHFSIYNKNNYKHFPYSI